MLQAIFFDRDGTLGGDGHFCHPSDFQLYPETERALGLARAAGVKLFAFTNQNRISLGQATLAEFEAEFRRLGFDGAYICPHGADEGCACRKPGTGSLLRAAAEHDLDLSRCAVIGDVGATDMLAAAAVGAVKVLVRTGWGESSLGEYRRTWAVTEPDHIAINILEAVAWLLDEHCEHAVTADYGGPVRLSWRPGTALPPTEGTSSVHGYCFHEGKVLLVDLSTRGLDIPGGRMEPGETAEECFRREAHEEGYVRGGTCTPLGYLVVDNSNNPNWRPGGRYPQIGYQVMYHMPVTELLPFEGKFESARRIFVAATDVPKYYHGWTGLGQHILRAAVAVEAKAR
jgi:histidinol-phosphate phosphatase family protein